MAPNLQDNVLNEPENLDLRKPQTELSGDEIVISGISGTFPRSDNVEEFMENLFDSVDMVTSHDDLKHPRLPKHSGKVNGLDKFDSQFFGVPVGQSDHLDNMTRKLLENAYGALFDAGINPKTLANTDLGVFSGASFADYANVNFYDMNSTSNYMMSGSGKTMMANRISYWLDAKGSSYSIDVTCASSMAALDHAYKAIKGGRCSSAIVTGSNVCFHPILTLNLKNAGFLCLDGKTKCFDKNGDGYVRSEAICALFLQKASDAKRIYAEVVHIKGKYFTRPDSNFLPLRKSEDIEVFLREFYSEVKISPKDVEYLEAFGAGIKSGDENELEAIGKIFAKDSTIKIGCVKSNMGHSEGASDMCALTKACLAYYKGQLPANLHYKDPLDSIPAVNDGRIQVLTETTPFRRSYTAINSFSYAGINQHALLKGHYKRKNLQRYYTPIPRLVLASGRVEASVSKIFDSMKSHPVDAEQIALLHDFFAVGISGHTTRGYLILDTNEKNETLSLAEDIAHFPGGKAPVWFLYSGMGSQWIGMGAELIRIPAFAASIDRCHKVLEPKGLDLIKIITSQDKSIFDNILHSFVGIAAIQIGLTDLLKEMGVVPDNIIGHSLGELGCAYADGCFSAEEMILLACCRGMVSLESKFVEGQMAAVGLGHKKLSVLCPPEIEVACHNSSESSTISGPANIVRKFIQTLRSKNIFAKEIETSKIAYHSKYIAEAGPNFLIKMKEIVKNPKLRSEKWLCTSALPENWDLPETKYSSAEYFTNNFLNNVYFEEVAAKIPDNATVIEIAPHGLMQAIMKKSHKSCTHIPLTRRGNSDPVKFLLEAVGKLFEAGLTPKIDFLYPKIEFPVSTETPLLSPLVKWAHTEDWTVAKYKKQDTTRTSSRNFAITINDDDWNYLKGHVRNGATIFPEMALLVLVWETLAMYKGLNYRDMSVIFEDVRFEKELYIRNKDTIRFTIGIQIGCCRFEITYKDLPIASGLIKNVYHPHVDRNVPEANAICDDVTLTAEDVYMLLRVRGCAYTGEFQSIISSNIKRKTANVKWTNEWVTFLDSLIQLNILSQDHKGVLCPRFIRKLTINTKLQKDIHTDDLTAYYGGIRDLTRCGGVQIDNLIFKPKPELQNESNILETRTFIPHFHSSPADIKTAVKVNLQIIMENITEKYLNVTELITESNCNKLIETVKNISEDNLSHFYTEINCVEIDGEKKIETVINEKQNSGKSNVFIFHNIMDKVKMLKRVFDVLENNAFILTTEHNKFDFQTRDKILFKIITCMAVGQYKMVLLRKTKAENNTSYMVVKHDSKFSWIPNVRRELDSGKRVVLVSKREECCGLPGFVNALKKDGFSNFGLLMINDYKAPRFSPHVTFYEKQIEKNLTFNTFKNGKWGEYYYLPKNDSNVAQNVMLTHKNIGVIDNLEMPCSDKVQVKISYAGILMDCIKPIGMDFSGYSTSGAKVMGLVSSRALSSKVDADPALLWPVPTYWSLEEAATVPLPYVYAYYCLMVRNNLEQDDSVLVLKGAGTFGQAIINICLELNCTVFTSVNNIDEQRLLLKIFPKLKEEHITYSEQDLHSMVAYHADKELLCKYVISCARGDLREQAMKCVGMMGTFIDVSDYDKEDNKEFGMSYLWKNRMYKSVNISSLIKPENIKDKKDLQLLVCEGIRSGVVKPLCRVVYSSVDVSKAFSYAHSTQPLGKVLISTQNTVAMSKQLDCTSGMSFKPEGSYIVIYDETILGVELADWLIRKGVKKVILHQTNNLASAYFQVRRETWKRFGVLSTLSTENLQTYGGCANLLNECEKLGPVQGIFIGEHSNGTTEINNNLQESVSKEIRESAIIVSNLDKASKKICKNLSYFVVISPNTNNLSSQYAVSAIEDICENRRDTELPALVIRTDSLNKTNTNSNESISESLSKLFDTLDKSLQYNYNNVVSRTNSKNIVVEFIKRVSEITGIPQLQTIEETKTLNSFKIDDAHVDEIRDLLNRTFKIDYSTEELQKISIASLVKLYKNEKSIETSVKGLRAFYSYIESDEIFAAEPIVIMHSKIASCTDKLPEEFDWKETHLIMIPGFEGHSRIFSSMGEMLKIQAAVLQLSPDLEGDSIFEMAEHLFKHVKASFQFNTNFYILGYSFGVNIALELASLLEKEGYLGVVYCLDSSPDAIKVQLNSYLGKLTKPELQNSVITELYSLITEKDNNNLDEELNNLDDWTKKVKHIVEKLQDKVTHSHEYLKAILESTYKRILLAKEYKPDIKLNSKIVLMKGMPHRNAEKLAYDYNLSKYTKQPVSVFQIESDHKTAPFDSHVSNIVNKMLEPKLLEDYKNLNLCEVNLDTYVKFQGSTVSPMRVVSNKKKADFIA